MFYLLCEFCADESGAAAIEYGLIAALVSVAGIVALTTAGEAVDAIVTTIADRVSPSD